MRRTLGIACVLAVIAIPMGGSSGRVVLPLWLDPASLAPPSDARALGSTQAAVRGVAAIMAKNFGLAVPDRVTVYVYTGRQAFEQGLIQDARVSPVLAAKLSDFAIGVGGRGQMLKGYFVSFAHSSDRRANFRRAFGESITDFESGMLDRLNTTLGSTVPSAPAEISPSSAVSSVP
ncbi:MAG: hypothetical protein DMD99_00030 [Candidatus Rokuibacteriota bacterium]|nr:MAG: hypothetical protein DMD99_00030 [Candidatus Rokubacteria bacterium]